ncbi:MAG TPA: Zn-dependent alcohol dehydrogenase, partial [Acidimicrobiales bacterium]|nr:Zn-dependent alcohol dehydrogenase [Acidimicrobiales bacterium]
HTALDQPLEIREDVEVSPPQAGELQIRMVASGVCHSDLSVQNGTIPLAPPMVLGHEGAGMVEVVGPGVEGFEPGDHVVLTWVPECGECFFCRRDQGYMCEKANAQIMGGLLDGTTRLTSGGLPLRQMALCGTFSERAVVPAICAVKIDRDIPLASAALLGCAVLTGVGAAVNTASIRSGDTVAVIGCGGVGLNVIQGARIAGAERIIAVDMVASKLELASRFGATDLVDATSGSPVSKVQSLTEERGVDVAFEVIGLKAPMEQALQMTRRGGETVFVGLPRLDLTLEISPAYALIYTGRSIKGCWYGSANVNREIPRLLDLYRSGDLLLDELISRRIGLDSVNEAFDAIRAGQVARSVIEF